MDIFQAPQELTKGKNKNFIYKAAVIDHPKSLGFVELEKKTLGEGELLIKIQGVGLCASTIPLWEGREWFKYPLEPGEPGHEGWGIIEEKGNLVKGYEVGQRVAILQGKAFAEYVNVPASDTVLLPPDLDGIPFPGEPLGCLMNILDRAKIQKGQAVAIIGLGFIGLGLLQLCTEKGVKVAALSRRNSSLEIASQHADLCVLMDDHYRIINELHEYTQGRGFDRVIECTGKQWPLDLATEIIGEYGRLVVAGYHQDGLRSVNMQKWNWKAIDVINAHERNPERYKEGISQAVLAVQSGVLKPLELLTHHFSFEELPEAMDILTKGPEGFVKGYIKF